MQTLYVISANVQGQLSVDVFSPKHAGPSSWRQYWLPSKSTVARLRKLWRANEKCFYVRREWSALRWRAYKNWVMTQSAGAAVAEASLDLLATSVQSPDEVIT